MRFTSLARMWWPNTLSQVLCVIVTGLVWALANHVQARPLSVSVQFHWYHQFEYAGFYAAVEQGYYRERGLEVKLLPGGPQISPIQRVQRGEVPFGVASSELVLAFLKGQPLVALAPIFQNSAAIFLVRSDSGIRRVEDLVGKRVEMGDLSTDAEAYAMLQAAGVSPAQVDRVPSSFSTQALVEGKVDGISGYITNQPYALHRQGIAFRTIAPQRYGINFYGDTLFTSNQVLQTQPKLVADFVEASLQGWKYAFQNSDEIIELILERYNNGPVSLSREHLEYERDQMMKLVMPGLVAIGHSNRDRWEAMRNTLVALGLVEPGRSLKGFLYKPDQGFDWRHPYVWIGAAVALILTLIVAILSYYNSRLQQEISRRRLVEGKHQDARRRLSLALWGGNLGCWDWDLDGNHVHLDRRGAELLGAGYQSLDIPLTQHSRIAELFNSLAEELDDDEIKAEKYIKCGKKGLWVLIRGKRLPATHANRRAFGTLMDVSSDHAYQEKLIKLSITDSLTGLLNRRYFFDRLVQSCSQAKRDGNLLSVALLDIDHFKSINDRFGHMAGDETLSQFARMLKEDCRPYDLVARYGGEEFIILFFGMDKEQACKVLERYRERLRTTQIVTENERFYCTFSCGIADSHEIPAYQLTSNELVRLADARLYMGKRQGRNRSVITGAA